MSHRAKRVGHNRAKIFYMSPNKKITLFHQSQYKITEIKSYFCSSTDFRLDCALVVTPNILLALAACMLCCTTILIKFYLHVCVPRNPFRRNVMW